MRTHVSPALEALFGPRRTGKDYRLPTPAEMAWRWNLERQNLMARAVWEEQHAYSHRNARYGVALLVCRAGDTDEERFAIVSAPNFTLTPRPKHRLKMCGERTSKGYATEMGYDHIVGVVVFSDNMQPDDVSGMFFDVQHPCWDCAEMLSPVLPRTAPLILFRRRGVVPCDWIDPMGGEFVVRTLTFGESLRLHNHETG